MLESICFFSVFASILTNPWNNPGNSIKEMALASRPEPYRQRKCLRLGSQSLAGLPSDRLPHRELPDLCAEHFWIQEKNGENRRAAGAPQRKIGKKMQKWRAPKNKEKWGKYPKSAGRRLRRYVFWVFFLLFFQFLWLACIFSEIKKKTGALRFLNFFLKTSAGVWNFPWILEFFENLRWFS